MTETPGWTRPGDEPLEQRQAQSPPPGWVAQRPPSVKPGVVPLRPLGVGEILDGAITGMRENPRTMLGLSAIVAILSQVLQLGLLWVMYRDLSVLEQWTVVPSAGDLVSLLAGTASAGLATGVVTFLATTVLTGILTMVVSRAVLGERLDAPAAWRMARPQLLRLVVLTILVGVVVAAPVVIGSVPGVLLAVAGADPAAAFGVVALGVLVALPISVWLYVRLALSTPALMLESAAEAASDSAANRPGGRPAVRRVGMLGAMRRSARLVSGAWWRMFGILLLVVVITWLVQQVIAIPATLIGFIVGGFGLDPAGPTFGGLLLTSLASFIGLTITMPFSAAVTVLLYVDRRIRREGLDIELARAAGVTIPGRTD